MNYAELPIICKDFICRSAFVEEDSEEEVFIYEEEDCE
jgi:indole-3-glycerol phosphate synthase